MPQLSNDCFAADGPMRVGEAVGMIRARLSAVDDVETVPLDQAPDRVLARDLASPLALPPFTNSAVDGYAVRAEDLATGAERGFDVVGRTLAGGAPAAPLSQGQAVRVFTGAPMPPGADTVFMQEDARPDGAGRVVLPPGLARGANVRRAGEDIPLGRVIAPAGRRLRPQDIAAAAAAGLASVEVRRRLRVAVFSNGDEVVQPGGPRGPAQVYDSNRFMLIALLRRLGCEVSDFGILPDDEDLIAGVLTREARGHDLVLTSGGVSVGEADLVRSSVERVGSLVFWRMAIKPGRPVAMGVIEGTPFIGLPGNPVASFVAFANIARPAIFALAGETWREPFAVTARAAFAHHKKAGRREYLPASLRPSADGAWEAVKFAQEGSARLSSLIDTDGLVDLPEDLAGLDPGAPVRFVPYSSLA